ncbi:MAG: hypothetical protein ACTHMB_03805 [Candidatus Binatia bacterium]
MDKLAQVLFRRAMDTSTIVMIAAALGMWQSSIGGLFDSLVAIWIATNYNVEIPFFGAKVVAVRFAVSFFFPFLAGWLCEIAWNKFHS